MPEGLQEGAPGRGGGGTGGPTGARTWELASQRRLKFHQRKSAVKGNVGGGNCSSKAQRTRLKILFSPTRYFKQKEKEKKKYKQPRVGPSPL